MKNRWPMGFLFVPGERLPLLCGGAKRHGYSDSYHQAGRRKGLRHLFRWVGGLRMFAIRRLPTFHSQSPAELCPSRYQRSHAGSRAFVSLQQSVNNEEEERSSPIFAPEPPRPLLLEDVA